MIVVKILPVQYAARSAAVAAPVSAGVVVAVVGDDLRGFTVIRHPLHLNIKGLGCFESVVPVSHHELTMRKHGRYFDLDPVVAVSLPASESIR